MKQSLNALRLAVAVTHAKPNAHVVVELHDGTSVCAGTHSDADIDLCALRKVVARGACPMRPDPTRWVREIRVGGALGTAEGDLFWSQAADREGSGEGEVADERWFGTFLKPEQTWDVLSDTHTGEEVHDRRNAGAVVATLVPDRALGVTVVRITAEGSMEPNQLAAAAQRAYRACLVEELCAGHEVERSAMTTPRRR